MFSYPYLQISIIKKNHKNNLHLQINFVFFDCLWGRESFPSGGKSPRVPKKWN